MSKFNLILVGGPTASGKSKLALDLAISKNGEIINADSMQIYKGLPILTAQPDIRDKSTIKHHLYEIISFDTLFSVGKWLSYAKSSIDDIIKRGKTPILTGGTGLYFEALIKGLANIPDIPQETRDKTIELYKELGEDSFRQKLSELDAHSAMKIAKNDKQRLIRAYEVALFTGKPLSYWQESTKTTDLDFIPEYHLLLPPREKLYKACDTRFENMIKLGAIEEASELLLKSSFDINAVKVLGFREIKDYIEGKITLDEATLKAQQKTRNYAKRQMTWFRNKWTFSNVIFY